MRCFKFRINQNFKRIQSNLLIVTLLMSNSCYRHITYPQLLSSCAIQLRMVLTLLNATNFNSPLNVELMGFDCSVTCCNWMVQCYFITMVLNWGSVNVLFFLWFQNLYFSTLCFFQQVTNDSNSHKNQMNLLIKLTS